MYKLTISEEITLDTIKALRGKKLERLLATLDRNSALTSTWDLVHGEVNVYKEGWYITLTGTRCGFSVFAWDRDGDIEIADRKPHDNKLHFLYTDSLHFGRCEIKQTAGWLRTLHDVEILPYASFDNYQYHGEYAIRMYERNGDGYGVVYTDEKREAEFVREAHGRLIGLEPEPTYKDFAYYPTIWKWSEKNSRYERLLGY